MISETYSQDNITYGQGNKTHHFIFIINIKILGDDSQSPEKKKIVRNFNCKLEFWVPDSSDSNFGTFWIH